MRHYTGSVYRDTRALAERHKPTDWCTTECDKIERESVSGHGGDHHPDSILVDICVFVVVNTPISDAE